MDVGKPSKKIIIRKFKRKFLLYMLVAWIISLFLARLNGHNFDKNWEILQDSILKIQKRQKALTTCEDLYSVCFFYIFFRKS